MLPMCSDCKLENLAFKLTLRLSFKEGQSGIVTSPNFPEGWHDQWRIEFRPITPQICYVRAVTPDSPGVKFQLMFHCNSTVRKFEITVVEPYVLLKLSESYTSWIRSGLIISVKLIISLEGKNDYLARQPLRPWEEEFRALLDSQLGSDVSIVSKNGKLAAHWAILAARSPFFSAMLKNDFIEKRQNEIELTELDNETAEKMLKFIYTNKVEIVEAEEGMSLLRAGDVYLIDGLKKIAEKFLCTRVTKENALDLLICSHLHEANSLKLQALDVLWLHPTSATKNEHYPDLIRYPELVAELLVYRGVI